MLQDDRSLSDGLNKMARELLDEVITLAIISGTDNLLATWSRINRRIGIKAYKLLYYRVHLGNIEQAILFFTTMTQPNLGSVFPVDPTLVRATLSLQFGFDVAACDEGAVTALRQLLRQVIPNFVMKTLTVYFSECNSEALSALSLQGITYRVQYIRLISVEADHKTASFFHFCLASMYWVLTNETPKLFPSFSRHQNFRSASLG
jgi:hypothetical protein